MTASDTDEKQALAELAAELFGPSGDTLSFVALGGEQALFELPPSVQQRLNSEEQRFAVDVLRRTLTASEAREGEGLDQSARLSTPPRGSWPPLRGEVRVVEEVDLNDPTGEQGRRFTEPMLVLLDQRHGQHPDDCVSPAAWAGWCVSSHVEFAAHWDVLTQGGQVPASCAMTQVWNPVQVAEDHLGRCRIKFDEQQFAQVQAVWLEYLSAEADPLPEQSEFHPLAAGVRSTPQGGMVVTGCPLRGVDDSRFMAQRLFGRAAKAVTLACKSYIAAHGTLMTRFEETEEGGIRLHDAYQTSPEGVWKSGVSLYATVGDSGSLSRLRMRSGDGDYRDIQIRGAGGARLIEGAPLDQQTESSWINLAKTTYAAAGHRLALHQITSELKGKTLYYQFLFALKRQWPGKPPIEEMITLHGRRYIDTKGVAQAGIFILSTGHPEAAKYLSGRIELELVVEPHRGSSNERRVRVILRQAKW